MRYKGVKQKRDNNGNRYFSPSTVPNIPIKDSDIFIYPKYGDRFDTLAQRYYNDSSLWWIIAKANEIGKGKIGLSPEKKVRIPTVINDILESVNRNNT